VLAGDHEAARESYTAFLKFWEHADEGLPLLSQARRELAAMP